MTFGQYRIDALFEVKKGKRLTNADKVEGNLPFIGAISNNNGISAYIDETPLHPGNLITVNYNGSIGEAFYQPEPFWASDDVNVLYPKGFEMNPYVGLYLCAVIRNEKYRFSYGRKWNLERMKATSILLPTSDNGNPDWEFMESYIKKLPAMDFCLSRLGVRTTESPGDPISWIRELLNDTGDGGSKPMPTAWKCFRLTDLFSVDYGNKFDANKMTSDTTDNTVAFVTRSAKNNGVGLFVDRIDDVEPYPAGCLTVALGGSLGSTFVQPAPFYTAQNVAVLVPHMEMSVPCKLFVATLIRVEATTKYTPFGRELNKYIKKRFSVTLPADISGNPDWVFMEDYVRSLPNGNRL